MAASDLVNLRACRRRQVSRSCASTAGRRVCAAPHATAAPYRDGRDDTQPCRQRYRCKACAGASTT